MPKEQKDECSYFHIQTEQLFVEQNVLVIDDNGEIPEGSTVPKVPRCTSPVVKGIRLGLERIALETIDTYCRGDFDKCNGYHLADKDKKRKLNTLIYLIENGKTQSTVALDNRKRDVPGFGEIFDINADIAITEDESSYFITMQNFRKTTGDGLDEADLSSTYRDTRKKCLEDIQSGEQIVVRLNKQTASVEYLKGRKIANYLGLIIFSDPLYIRVNKILDQMIGS